MSECVHGIDTEWCATCAKTDDEFSPQASNIPLQGGLVKQDLLNQITDLLDLRRYVLKQGGGSSLPSEVFDAAARRVGVPVISMPEICESIVRKAGHPYSPAYDSRATLSGGGSTVTLAGMQAMLRALHALS